MLSENQIDSLSIDGACVVPGYLTTKEVDNIRKGIDEDLSLQSPFKTEIRGFDGASMITNIWRSKEIDEFNAFCTSDKLISLVREIFNGLSFRFLQDTWFHRPKSCSVEIPWHHDNIIEGIHYSIWISLTEHGERDSLKFVAGSHKRKLEYMPKSYFNPENTSGDVEDYYHKYNKISGKDLANKFVPVPSNEEIERTEKILSWPTRPGDCIIFNSRVLHSLGCHAINNERSGFVTRWIEEGSRVAAHAEETVKTIIDAGLDVDIMPGAEVKGSLFTLYR